MNNTEIWDSINENLRKAKKECTFPIHIVAQTAMINAAAGELTRAAIELKYHERESEFGIKAQQENIKEAAVNSAVQAIRFLQELNF